MVKKKLNWLQYGSLRLTTTTLGGKGARKGKYVVVLEPKSKKRRYYKYIKDARLEDYYNAFYGDVKYRKGSVKVKDPKSSYIKVVSKAPRIDSVISKGIEKIGIRNIRAMSEGKARIHYKKVLRPLVLDEGILNLLTSQENIRKLKKRFMYTISFMDKENTERVQLKVHGKTINEVSADIKSLLQREQIDGRSLDVLSVNKGYQKVVFRPNKETGEGYLKVKELKRVFVTLTFTKGR